MTKKLRLLLEKRLDGADAKEIGFLVIHCCLFFGSN